MNAIHPLMADALQGFAAPLQGAAPTAATTRDAWLAERRRGIGGSDAPAVLGISPWRTPLDVWLDKTGQADDTMHDSDAMFWGRTLEPVIRQQYAERTGRIVRVPVQTLQHPTHAFMLANLDGVTDDRRLLEIKTARSGADWGEPGTDEIPEPYLVQVQHYLCVTSLAVADVAVLIGGSDFRLYEVPADRELQQMLIEAEADFWRLVETRTPPEPRSYADTVRRYGRSATAGTVLADADLVLTVKRLRALREQQQELAEMEEAAKAAILQALGDRGDTLVGPDGKLLVTWKLTKPSRRTDWKALVEHHWAGNVPRDLLDQFTSEIPGSRRFLIK